MTTNTYDLKNKLNSINVAILAEIAVEIFELLLENEISFKVTDTSTEDNDIILLIEYAKDDQEIIDQVCGIIDNYDEQVRSRKHRRPKQPPRL